MYVRGLVVVLLLFASSSPGLAREPAPGGEVWISSGYRPGWVEWDSGSLEFTVANPEQELKSVNVTFQKEKLGNLHSLVITTDEWTFDATEHVEDIPFAFPTRIGVALTQWEASGEFGTIVLTLPYRESSFEVGPCMFLNLHITSGQLSRSYSLPVPSERCGH